MRRQTDGNGETRWKRGNGAHSTDEVPVTRPRYEVVRRRWRTEELKRKK